MAEHPPPYEQDEQGVFFEEIEKLVDGVIEDVKTQRLSKSAAESQLIAAVRESPFTRRLVLARIAIREVKLNHAEALAVRRITVSVMKRAALTRLRTHDVYAAAGCGRGLTPHNRKAIVTYLVRKAQHRPNDVTVAACRLLTETQLLRLAEQFEIYYTPEIDDDEGSNKTKDEGRKQVRTDGNTEGREQGPASPR